MTVDRPARWSTPHPGDRRWDSTLDGGSCRARCPQCPSLRNVRWGPIRALYGGFGGVTPRLLTRENRVPDRRFGLRCRNVSAPGIHSIDAFSQLVVGFPQLVGLAGEGVTILLLLFASFFDLGVKLIVLVFKGVNTTLKLL